jgi:hypothetical protein
MGLPSASPSGCDDRGVCAYSNTAASARTRGSPLCGRALGGQMSACRGDSNQSVTIRPRGSWPIRARAEVASDAIRDAFGVFNGSAGFELEHRTCRREARCDHALLYLWPMYAVLTVIALWPLDANHQGSSHNALPRIVQICAHRGGCARSDGPGRVRVSKPLAASPRKRGLVVSRSSAVPVHP